MKRAFLLLALAACGGKIEEVSTGTSTSSGAPAPTTTPTTTSVPPSPGPTPTPVPPKDPTPTPSGTKLVTAQAQPGGLDHLFVFAADKKADSCIRIHLTNPFGASPSDPYAGVVAPAGWGVRNITRSPGANRCGPGKQPPAAEEADAAKGNVSFTVASGAVYPCTISVHVSALFAENPTVEQIDDDVVAVAGCQ